jgi:Chaperone of endosialidase
MQLNHQPQQKMKTKNMTTLHLRKSVNRSPWRRGFLLIPLVLGCFALSPAAQAVTPAPDGGYPGNNTAEGTQALLSNTTGVQNTALGFQALSHNTDGTDNTATGFRALVNSSGDFNVATGWQALFANTVGDSNTAVGLNALLKNVSGDRNIGLGAAAGSNLTTGDDNIDIGNPGVAGERETTRIGTTAVQTRVFIAGIRGAAVTGSAVVVNTSGQLGVAPSSERFKEAIKPMDKASELILALKPVTFHYKKQIDPKGIPQFGLVAEEVEKVNPALVTRDAKGEIYTVRYDAVNAMLLNEFLKEHRKVEEQEAMISQVKSTVAKQDATIAQQQKDFQSTIAQQQKEIKALTVSLKEQASQIQKVSAQFEVSKPAPQMAVNNQ